MICTRPLQLAGQFAVAMTLVIGTGIPVSAWQANAPHGQPVTGAIGDQVTRGDPIPAKLNAPADQCDTLVLCPPALAESLVPWLMYRQQQGHRIHIQSPPAEAFQIRQLVRSVARNAPLRNVVLVGDTPDYRGTNRHVSVATDYVPARVVSKFGSEPEIASDNVYADLDDDGLPDLTIGRLPADSPGHLSVLVDKIICYESSEIGPWQRRINLVAGTGGFGEVSDNVIEKASRGMISDLIPPAYRVSLTWANWSSAFCPDPREFADTTVERLNEGCLFWVYMGHGDPHRLDYVRTPIGGYPMFGVQDVERVQCRNGLPVALMLACYTGAFDLPNDCLAERLVLQPGGPVSAVCSTRVSMPYGMSALSLGLIDEYFNGRAETLGEMLLLAKRRINESGASDDPRAGTTKMFSALRPAGLQDNPHQKYRETIRVLGETFSPVGDQLSDEAEEHAHLFHLLGDPLLRMKRPERLELTVREHPESPRRLIVSGRTQRSGELMVELSYARDRFQARPPRRNEFRADSQTLSDYQKVYDNANQRTVTQKMVQVQPGEFKTELDLPAWARGRCVVRGFMAAGPERFAMGASAIHVKRR